MTFSERLSNEYKRLYTFFSIQNGKGYYLEDGIPYTRKEFEKRYPIPLKLKSEDKGQDIDGTRKWLY